MLVPSFLGQLEGYVSPESLMDPNGALDESPLNDELQLSSIVQVYEVVGLDASTTFFIPGWKALGYYRIVSS